MEVECGGGGMKVEDEANKQRQVLTQKRFGELLCEQ